MAEGHYNLQTVAQSSMRSRPPYRKLTPEDRDIWLRFSALAREDGIFIHVQLRRVLRAYVKVREAQRDAAN